jgi:asparagine synthase (glutamine-hydrolysing)
LAGANSRLLFLGDVRLDNREHLAAHLELAPGQRRELSDAELALAAWERWGEESVDRLRGDYALAVWSDPDRTLILVRGPLSARQIFYHCGDDAVVFASVPQSLFAPVLFPKALDRDNAARFVGGVAWPGEGTFFAGVSRLRPGTLARFTPAGSNIVTFWRPQRDPTETLREDEYAERMVELLDRAVAAQLQRDDGLVAAHLSAGRDSGAVATSAAIALGRAGEPLLAFTAAPRANFGGSGLPNRIDDESELAAATAALYSNMRHRVVRPDNNPFAEVEPLHRIVASPIASLSNFQWGRDVQLAARDSGVSVMLAATVGNLAISAGDEWHLPALLSEEGLGEWWSKARCFIHSPVDYLRVLNWTFGGSLPTWMHRAGSLMVGGGGPIHAGLPLLREAHRHKVRSAVLRQTDRRGLGDPFAFRGRLLLDQDPSSAMALLWGVDVREPVADRDLIEFCFSVPARLLVGPPGTRPLCDRAFGARLGWPAGSVRPRGYQGADWYLSFTPERIVEALAQPRRHELVRELIDFDHVDRMLANWPAEWTDVALMLHYRNDLLRAVSAANFIAVNF